MKITQNPQTQRKEISSSPSFFKAAAKKLSGVFTIFFFRKARSGSNKNSLTDGTRNSSRVGRIPTSSSYTSKGSSSKSSFKYSSSASSSSAASGQIGGLNFSIEEIYKATDRFSPANIIGEGGFGTVYKGKLKDGSLVAVKLAKKKMHDNQLGKEFKNEILTMSKIEHLNLVRLYGYVEHGDERVMIVEFVGNGTLREHLDGTRGTALEMGERLEIAIDVAHALTYLHMYTDSPIIHRDIKSSNILITEKLRAKVADFGYAKLTPEDYEATHISTQVKGTSGYLDPEYLRTYRLTEKSDVYSFGVLLVELVTGRHPIEQKKGIKERITATWAMKRMKAGDAIFTMDPRLRRSPESTVAVERVLKLAQQCLLPLRQSRPSMKECAKTLWEIRRDFREKRSSSPPTTHRSDNFVQRDARRNGGTLPVHEEDGDNYKFVSA